MIKYKLVRPDCTTYNDTKWKVGELVTVVTPGNKMCSNQVLHCYSNPYFAVIFNPIHADYCDPRLIEIECNSIVNTDGLKEASKTQTMLRELPLPVLSTAQKVVFALKCVMLVYKDPAFVLWANAWIMGEDRSAGSAKAAEAAVPAAAKAAEAAAWAAKAAEIAVEAAAEAAEAYPSPHHGQAWAAAWAAAKAAEIAVEAAVWAAKAAAEAARTAACIKMGLLFTEIINDVVKNYT